MQTIPVKFRFGEDGFSHNNHRIFEQVVRNEKFAIYKRTVEKTGRPDGYEVIQIRIKPKGTRIFQKVLEEDEESYPSSSMFGMYGAYVTHIGRAEEIFEKLTKEANSPKVAKNDEDYLFPDGEFTITDFCEFNSISYSFASMKLKISLSSGRVMEVGFLDKTVVKPGRQMRLFKAK